MNRESISDLGLDLVVAGTIISAAGVIANNLFLLHILAMQIWTASNFLFALYFYGRSCKWWDGGLCDKIMCLLYTGMLVTGLWGLMVK
jgi:hypothetical protein